MSSTQDLVDVLKSELKRSRMTYAALARELKLAESSVKRMFARAEMPLSRVDAICKVLKLDFADLARQVADAQPAEQELTQAQERALVADPKLLLMAICCLSQWTIEQVLATYRYTEVECVRCLTRLDKLGIIELRPYNRYRLKVTKGGLRWRADGPVMQYFREHVAPDFFSGSFDGEGELLTLVHGSIAAAQVDLFNERLQRVAQDFAQQHLADQRLPEAQRRGYALVIGLRNWLFAAFEELRRP